MPKFIRHSLAHLRDMDLLQLTFALVLCLSLVTFATSFLFPLYPDEVAVRMWLSRTAQEFPDRVNLFPTCVSSYSQPLPITWTIPGLIDWLLHGNTENIFLIRLTGEFIAGILLLSLAFALPKALFFTPPPESECFTFKNLFRSLTHSVGFVISILTVGVLPIFLITNRQEQLILPSVIALLYVFISSKEIPSSSWRFSILIVLYLFSVSLILYAHPKGLFLAPFILLIGYVLLKQIKSRSAQILFSLIIFLHFLFAYKAWKYSFYCPEVPRLDALLNSFSFDPASLFYAPTDFTSHVLQSIARFKAYVYQIGFRSHTDIEYLPPVPLTFSARLANIFVGLNFIIAFFFLIIRLPVTYLRNDIAHRRWITLNGALTILLLCVLASAIFNLPKNWYDAGYVYTLLIIIWIFFLREAINNGVKAYALRKLLIYLGCVSLLSQSVFIYRNLPSFINGYKGPSLSSVIDYDHSKFQSNLSNAANQCGIDSINGHKIIVDDYTYQFFQKSKRPMAITYLFLENDPKSAIRFISQSASTGLITKCDSLPAFYAPFAHKTIDGICCISGSSLRNLSESLLTTIE